MTDLETRIRELTYRLVETAPEPPPFPVGDVPRRARRPALVWAAATVAVLALVALPVLFLLPTSDEPATSAVAGPGPDVTSPPATAPPATVPATVPPPVTSAPAVTASPRAVPVPPPAGLTLSADRGIPGDEVTICGTYSGESEVTLDVGHPATGYRWAEPINATIEVGDDGAWCWTGVVPGSLLGIGPQGEDVTVAVQPGTYEVRAGSYPEDYAARATFVVDGVGALGVTLDQGWSYVSTQPEVLISGHAFGHDALRLSSQRRSDLEVEIVERDGRYEVVVPLVPGADVIQVLAESRATQQFDAVAEIAVRYLPQAEQRVAFIVEVRPAAGEIVVDFAEFLQGEEALAAAAEDGATVSPLTGLYVDNPEEIAEVLSIEANPPIIIWSPDEVPRPNQITYEEWYGGVLDEGVPRDGEAGEAPDPRYFGAGLVGAPYRLTIHEGTVVQVELFHAG